MSRSGACPSCLGPVTFEVGSSRAAVCRFCNTLVVRRGQNLDAVGKIAELVATGTRIALGASGNYLGEHFTVVGRVQLEWTQGVWDEWYVSFPDERWGWLAEAGGKYYLTFELPSVNVPARSTLSAGERIELGRQGTFVVTDIKSARVVAAAGELPEEVPLEGTVWSVDLEGSGGAFATIDYGKPGDEPVTFAGKEVLLEDLGLKGGVPAEAMEAPPEGEAITCGNCGAPLTIRVPGQTVRLVCGSCNALLDGKKHAGKVIAILDKHREEPPIPLGTKGKLRGADVIVVGWMQRGCQVDYVHYPWDELLLYDPKTTALTWLVCSDGHWSIARSISAAEVDDFGSHARYRNKKYKLFSKVIGEVEYVLGEFPWKVKVGEQAVLEDYVAPPEGLSEEHSGSEINWSHVEHLDPKEVAEAFGVPQLADEPRRGVGPVQPWPFDAFFRGAARWMIGGVAAAIVLFFVFALRDEKLAVRHTFGNDDTPTAEPAAEGDPAPDPATLSRLRTFVSEPIELSGHEPLEVRVVSDVSNSWAWVEGAVINDDSGEASFFGLETAYYSGYDGGEYWSEGSTHATQTLSAPPRGRYVVRADMQWDPQKSYAPSVTFEIHKGGWSGGQFLAAVLTLLAPLLLLFHRQSFEKKRWEESNQG
jgi:hypothetical protein